ncbi:MAG TPA: DUF4188 domain-containing protein [Ignavibacteria bacterium]|jgi:hypothetical protein
MAKTINKRMFAKLDGEFVVFMIGMRVNSFRKIHKWWPVAMAMPKMLKELYANPDSGFLGAQAWFGRTSIMVQYWGSFGHLERYAKDKSAEHFPAWKEFNLKVRQSGAVGIWHESYKASSGTYENIYVNMPAFGLGKAGKLLPVTEKYEHAKQRITSTT